MHSNGGCGLVPEARSPVRGESRRAGHPAAPARRRSCGARELIAGACVEQLRTTSAIGFPRLLFICYDPRLVGGAALRRSAADPAGRVGLLRRLNDVLTNGPNENRVSIVFSVERKSGMERSDRSNRARIFSGLLPMADIRESRARLSAYAQSGHADRSRGYLL